MEAVKFVLDYFQLFDKYPFLAWNIPFVEIAVWQGMTKLFFYACIYRFLRWFLLTGWLLKLLELLAGHLWVFIITIISQMILGFWQFLTRIAGLLIQEMLKYRITKILLIGGSIYGLFRLLFVIKHFINQ